MVEKLNKGWEEFFSFGKDLLSKYENPTTESYIEGARMIREVCPIKAALWMDIAEDFVEHQSQLTLSSVEDSYAKEKAVTFVVIAVALFSIIISLILGLVFSKKLSDQIMQLSSKLINNVKEVRVTSEGLLKISSDLSVTAKESENSIQETIVAIDEISSMVTNNAESANNSSNFSQRSNQAALKGKATVEAMINSIKEIEQNNDEIIKEIDKNIADFSKIVDLISSI